MPTTSSTVSSARRRDAPGKRQQRLPFVIYVLAVGTFLMLTTEFVVAGILPEMASDLQVDVAAAGLLITVFAVGMVIGAPLMAMLTLRLPRRLTLIFALIVFSAGHIVVALSSSLEILLAARFVTALATGAFWSVAGVVAIKAAGPGLSARAMGLVGAGGMLATAVGVPLGAFVGQSIGWRGAFWALAILSVVAIAFIARHVPHVEPDRTATVSIRSELKALRSGRLWLVLAGCATTTGGVLAAYSYITPLLTDEAAIPHTLVPLVLAGFGVGALVGSLVGGRLGDRHPSLVTIVAPTASTLVLLCIALLAGSSISVTLLVILLGLFGLSANPVLSSLAVRFASHAPTLGSSLSVSAYNVGTAIGSWFAGRAIASQLGATGPVIVGIGFVALTLIPVITLALLARRAKATAAPAGTVLSFAEVEHH